MNKLARFEGQSKTAWTFLNDDGIRVNFPNGGALSVFLACDKESLLNDLGVASDVEAHNSIINGGKYVGIRLKERGDPRNLAKLELFVFDENENKMIEERISELIKKGAKIWGDEKTGTQRMIPKTWQ